MSACPMWGLEPQCLETDVTDAVRPEAAEPHNSPRAVVRSDRERAR